MLYYDRQEGDARIVVWHITEDYEELLQLLPDADTVQTEAEDRFHSQKRITEWTAVRVLLCTVLDRQVQIEYNDMGAPRLPDYEGLNISISHTRDYVAIALSETSQVGIDVEQIEDTDTPRVERVKTKFMNDGEHADTDVGLLLHWSGKETVYKVLGRDGVDFRSDLQVQPFDETAYEGEFLLDDLREETTYKVTYKVFEEFVLTFTRKDN